jgi:fimbrial chaperone protein
MTKFSNMLIPDGHRPVAFLLGLLVSVLVSGAALAFQLVPIIQDFEPSGRGANQTFQVENDRDEPVTVTIAMAVRKVDIDGKETNEATEDFTVFPTEVLLQPKSSRLVRVKWVGDPAPKGELAYRIIAEETPLNMRRTTPGASLFLTIRYVGSVYVVPKSVRPDVVVASAQPIVSPRGTRMLEVVLENRGQRHGVLDAPQVTVTAGGTSRTLNGSAVAETLAGENILAQSRRRFVLPLPADLPEGPIKAELKYSLLQ